MDTLHTPNTERNIEDDQKIERVSKIITIAFRIVAAIILLAALFFAVINILRSRKDKLRHQENLELIRQA